MKRSLQGALVAAATSLVGCAGQFGMPSEEQLLVEAREGRAFGRVEFLEDGREFDRGSLLSPRALSLLVRSATSENIKGGATSIARDGTFNWNLRPGNYWILSYGITSGSGPVTRGQYGRIMGSFSVPRVGAAVYIGDLRIESRGPDQGVQVLDRYDDALKRNGALGKLATEKALMRLERPPGSYRRVKEVCDGSWGVACDDDYRGLRPMQPDGTVRGFPTTQSLQPVLEWSPSARVGVTYDVAIFESFDSAVSRTGRGRGPLVTYAEGLTEARYVPTTPLEPQKRYEWTVRVRDGDTVSTWSTTNYGWYAGVAGVKGSGRAFGFETPGRQ